MRSQSWFGKLWQRLSAGVVQDVPPRLDACEACREVDCTQERWESCERRLATEAAALRARAGEMSELSPQTRPESQGSEAEVLTAEKPKPAPS